MKLMVMVCRMLAWLVTMNLYIWPAVTLKVSTRGSVTARAAPVIGSTSKTHAIGAGSEPHAATLSGSVDHDPHTAKSMSSSPCAVSVRVPECVASSSYHAGLNTSPRQP